jgi:hypothetical protein
MPRLRKSLHPFDKGGILKSPYAPFDKGGKKYPPCKGGCKGVMVLKVLFYKFRIIVLFGALGIFKIRKPFDF